MAAEKKDEKEPVENTEPDEKPEKPSKPVVTEDDDGAVRVQLGEDNDDAPTARGGRRERRESWKSQREEELRRVREDNENLRQQQMRMQQEMAQRIAQVESRVPRGEDPYQREHQEIRRQQEMIQRTLRSGSVQSDAEIERLREQFYELDNRSKEVDRHRIKQEVMQEFRQQQSQQSGQYEEQALRSEFPEVIQHQQAMRWATGRYYQMVAEGKPSTLATSRAAIQEAAEQFGLRRPQVAAPSDSQRQKFGAVSAQAGTRTNGNEIRLESAQKKMAVARWPQLDEHEAYTRMAALLRKTEQESSG